MHILKSLSHHKLLMIICLLVSCAIGCGSSFTGAAKVRAPQDSPERFSGKGLRVTIVNPGGQGQQAGLQPMDIIFRYGEFELVDKASYFAARDAYENKPQAEIPLLVWRDKVVRTVVGPGKLGIQTNEYNPVSYQFASLMKKVEALQAIPEYLRAVEFKDSYEDPKKILDEAQSLIDQAEKESTLTPAQILVARITMVRDDAPPEDQKRQSELLGQLTSTQPASYVIALGQDHFFPGKHYRAAAACFKRYLELHPDDVSYRLNMGVAYFRLEMFAEAEAAADYVLRRESQLGSHGRVVAYEVKSMGLLGRGDYAQGMAFSQKAFEIEPSHFHTSLEMLAAAQTGNVEKVAAASRKLQQRLPDQFEARKLQLAAVEALALVKSNNRSRAQELAKKWKDTDRAEGRLKAYWKTYPGGSDVWTTWNELTRN